MTDKTGFSLDFSVTPANVFKPLPDWVAFDLCNPYPVPDGNLLLHNTRNGKRAMIMPEVYASLMNCRQFKTLDQHTASLIDSSPGMQDQQTDVRNVLQSMFDTGMMVSGKKLCDSLKSKTETRKEETSRPVVAIITWERPQALERLLNSIATNCETGKLDRVYVIDDSRKAENISQNQSLVESCKSKFKTPLLYFGQDEQQLLLDGLAKRLPEHDKTIRFLADQSRWRSHWTSGLARNLALLVSVGRRLVVMDDDTICDVYNPPQPKPNITFSDDPREAVFFSSEQDWAHQHQPINPDPIDRHMQCLGLTFSEALDVLGQQHLKPAGFSNSTAQLTSELTTDSPVLITECGTLGCPGTDSNTWLPDMAPESLKRMLASEQKTNNALNSRLLWSGRNQPHFAPRPNMSAVTGFDNRQLLPPYLPFLRGEDRLFGNMLDFIHPSAVTLDYPWAIPHLPIPQRKWGKQDHDFTPGDSYPLFFVDQVSMEKSSCHSTKPVDRLSALSTWVRSLSVASTDAMAAMYRDVRLRNTAEQLQLLSRSQTASESASKNWQEYLQNGIAQLTADLEKVSREDFPIKGLPGSMDEAELIAFWKETFVDFADALNAWPQIREAAAEHLNP